MHRGMRVRLWHGRQATTGEIADIPPTSDALPTEFQTAFRPDQPAKRPAFGAIDPGRLHRVAPIWNVAASLSSAGLSQGNGSISLKPALMCLKARAAVLHRNAW